MKVLKQEIIWLIICAAGYFFYNLPGFPAYGDAKTAIVHGVISIIWVWVANYVGITIINRIYKLRKVDDEEEQVEVSEEAQA